MTYETFLPASQLAGVLVPGEAYTVYSRPDRERKRAARGRGKVGTREEVAEGTVWVGEAEEEWCRLDVSHIVRDRDWVEVVVVVVNSVRFMVV